MRCSMRRVSRGPDGLGRLPAGFLDWGFSDVIGCEFPAGSIVGRPRKSACLGSGGGVGRGGLFSSVATLGLGSYLQRGTVASAEIPAEQVVARITGTQNSLWRHDASPPASGLPIGYGSQLVAGQELTLEEGLAEITFQDGATVLVESPARFVVQPHDVQLVEGRLAAMVPTQSHGFRVQTRGLDVYDVGTEFGLLARSSGAAELHVFSGVAKANILDAQGQPLRQRS